VLMLELTREIHDLIEVEARTALDSGWAELRMEEGEIGPMLHLEPVKLASAPLEVFFDSNELVVCSPGRKGMACEFFSQEQDEIKERVRALAAAVVAGNYVERQRSASSEMVAEWPGRRARRRRSARRSSPPVTVAAAGPPSPTSRTERRRRCRGGIDSPRTYRSVVKGSPVQVRRGPATVTGWRSSRAPRAPATGAAPRPREGASSLIPEARRPVPGQCQFNPRGKGG
jgi:hypothetical protein